MGSEQVNIPCIADIKAHLQLMSLKHMSPNLELPVEQNNLTNTFGK